MEGSELIFPDLVQLICAYCHTRDILLLQLQLPKAIRQAATHKELEAISHLGIGKGSPLLPIPQMDKLRPREKERHSGTEPVPVSCLPLGTLPDCP